MKPYIAIEKDSNKVYQNGNKLFSSVLPLAWHQESLQVYEVWNICWYSNISVWYFRFSRGWYFFYPNKCSSFRYISNICIYIYILLSLSADISVTAEIFKPFTLLIQYYRISHKVFNFINMTSSFNNLTYLLNLEYSVYSEKHNEWNQNS